jgi:hypothetical protein
MLKVKITLKMLNLQLFSCVSSLGFSCIRGPRDMPVCLVILCPQLRLSESVVPPECF